MSEKNSRILKQLRLSLRIAIGIGLLAFLISRTDTGTLFDGFLLAANQWPWLLAGIMMTFFGLLAGAVRWQRFLAVQGIAFHMRKIMRIYFIGQFFNAFMLGAWPEATSCAHITRPRDRKEGAPKSP